jgi:branched-chain amino acid aminotransferase
VYTPAPSADILDGITKYSVAKIAQNMGYSVDARTSIARSELYNADELFFVGTGAEITPIVSVDEIKVGAGNVGPHTTRIRDRFFKIVHRKTDNYEDWFTTV